MRVVNVSIVNNHRRLKLSRVRLGHYWWLFKNRNFNHFHGNIHRYFIPRLGIKLHMIKLCQIWLFPSLDIASLFHSTASQQRYLHFILTLLFSSIYRTWMRPLLLPLLTTDEREITQSYKIQIQFNLIKNTSRTLWYVQVEINVGI